MVPGVQGTSAVRVGPAQPLGLTFREEHGVQPQAGPVLQARGQLGEVVAVEVEDDPQRLPAALDVVEDVGVCGRTWWGRRLTTEAGGRGGGASHRPLLCVLGPPVLPTPGCRLHLLVPHGLHPETPTSSHPLGVASEGPAPTLGEAAPDLPFQPLHRSQFPLLNPGT